MPFRSSRERAVDSHDVDFSRTRLTTPRSVKPYRRNVGLPGSALPASEPADPIGDEVLTHLEEWGYQQGGDAFGDLILGDEVLTHFEEWTCQDDGDTSADSTNSVPQAGLPGTTRVPTPSEQAHPLWDRDLDG
jgi:hypothetical protein